MPPLPSKVMKPLLKSTFLPWRVKVMAHEVPVNVDPFATTIFRPALKLVVELILF